MSDSKLFDVVQSAPQVTKQIAVDCTALQGLCELPLGNELLDAAFTREGHDLLVTVEDTQVIAENYFRHELAPTLLSETGKKIAGNSIDVLTKASMPQEYAGPVSSAPSIGTVEKLEGSVTVQRGGVDVELKQGDAVFQNDVVQTADNGKIGITFEDGSVFTLGSDARMTLDSFVYDAETGDGSSSINVIKGMFKFVSGEIAANNPGEMQVETPVATIGIRGTTGGGSVQGEGMDNQFYLEPNADGTVGWFDVMTDKGTTSMNQPNTVVGIESFHQAPPAPKFVSPEHIHQNFEQVVDFSPAGKYETRENAEGQDNQADADAPQNEGDAQAAAQEESAEGEGENNADAENGEEVEAEAAGDDASVDAENADNPDAAANGEEVEAADEQQEAAADEQSEAPEAINTTMSGENKGVSAFDQAQQTLEGKADGLPQNGTKTPKAAKEPAHNADTLETANAADTAETQDAANNLESSLDEQIESSRDSLVESVLVQQQTGATATVEEETTGTETSGSTGSEPPLPPVGENEPPLPPVGEEEGEGEPEVEPEGESGGNEPPAPPPPANPSLVLDLTAGNDVLDGGAGNYFFVVNNAADLTSGDVITGGEGTDTLEINNGIAASLTGLANVSGIERVKVTADNSFIDIDQAFIDQRDASASGIEIDFGAHNIDVDLTGLSDESGVELNGTGMVTFGPTAGTDFHQAKSADGVSISFDLSTNAASGEFELSGGSNTLSGANANKYLGIDQLGGYGHQFTLNTGDADIELTNVNTGVMSEIANITGSAADLYVDINNSRDINVSATSSIGARVFIDSSQDVSVTGGSNYDIFNLTGNNSGLVIDGGTSTDNDYVLSNFSGDALLKTIDTDYINLYNISSADLTLFYQGASTNSEIRYNMNFDSFTLKLGDFVGTAADDLKLSAGSNTITIDTLSAGKYSYVQMGEQYLSDFGIFQEYAERDLTLSEYADSDLYSVVNGTFSTSGVDLGTMETVDGSVKGDDITIDAAFQKVFGYEGDDTITVNQTTENGGTERNYIDAGGGHDTIILNGAMDYISVDGGDGFDILDLSNLGGSVTLDGGMVNNGDQVSQIYDIEAYITGGSADSLTGSGSNEIFNAGGGADTITGGGGIDTVTYTTSGAAVDVDLSLATSQTGGDADGDILSGIRNVIGSNSADTLTGDNFSNELTGGAGNDVLSGADGDDTLMGGAGDDNIDGGNHSAGDTVSYAHATGAVNVDLVAGSATGEGNDTLTGIEHIIGSNHSDTLKGLSNSYIQAGNGDDTIIIQDMGAFSGGGGWADGQSGFDTLKIVTLGGSTSISAVDNIERIDFGDGTGDDIMDISNFNSSAAAGVTGADNNRLELVSDAGDELTIHADWTLEGDDGNGYSIYVNTNNGVELAISDDLIVSYA